jgi:hypothetical protein
LVVAESYDPGWRARVDGRPQPVHRINGDFLGCLAGAGSRQVILEFRPRSLSAGRAIAFCGLCLVVLSLCIPLALSFRRTISPDSSCPAMGTAQSGPSKPEA